MTERPPAVVIGDMDLVRPLGRAGIRCLAAGPTGPETAWSRYTVGSIRLSDLWNQPEQVVEQLIDYACGADVMPVLIYQKDPAVLAISRHRAVLSRHYRFVIPEAGVVEDLVDKQRFQHRSVELGLPVPKAVFGCPADSGPPDLEPPLVVKPVLRDKTDEAWLPVADGRKAILCPTSADLRRLWNRPEIRHLPLVVQEYVRGDAEQIVSYHAFIDDDGTTIGYFTGRKIRTTPREFGQSTAVEITDDPACVELGRRVLEAFGATGVAKVDMKRDEDGALHVLEVNPRFNLWHHPGAEAGVNLPAAVYRRLVDGTRDVLPLATPGIRWVQIWGDVRAAREEDVTVPAWLVSAATAQARRAAHLSDPGAMLGAFAWGMDKARNQRLRTRSDSSDQ
jgi:D-aspartate ligase